MLVDVIRVLQIYYTDSTVREGYLSVNENVMNTESYDTQTQTIIYLKQNQANKTRVHI